MLLEYAGDVLHRVRGHERLAILRAVRHRNGNAPAPLPRYAPVGAVLDHAADAFFAPRGNPPALRADRIDGIQRRLADRRPADVAVQRDPPLVGRAKDDRVLATPTVRVAVADLERTPAGIEQCARRAQLVDDLGIRLEDVLALEPETRLAGESPPVVHRCPDRQAVPDAHLKVVFA